MLAYLRTSIGKFSTSLVIKEVVIVIHICTYVPVSYVIHVSHQGRKQFRSLHVGISVGHHPFYLVLVRY